MTTTKTTTPVSATRRLLSISAAATIAAVGGLVGLSAPAHAADADSDVWVCKYVGTPGDDEVLKEGKNPIKVSGNSVDKDKDGQVFVGDQFADAQGRSVVVQIEGDDPGDNTCSPTPPRCPQRCSTCPASSSSTWPAAGRSPAGPAGCAPVACRWRSSGPPGCSAASGGCSTSTRSRP